ncbi:PBECR4 domain-containing protein [Fusobacterium watanabei]|uniref:PBECR4 domain-containing protein n=1 Tax=Fusobacterium TaxID=848 RepID=UPI0030A6608B
MDFKAKETIEWYEQFDNTNLIIKNNFKDINIKILKDNLPHLLGLHYMYPGNKIPPAREIAEEVKILNITDEEILKNVKKYNLNMLKSVKNRITTLKEFLENFENGVILENTKRNSNINSKLFVIKTKDKKIMHLGIKEVSGITMLENYSEMSPKEMKGIFETYFLRNNDKFTQNSKIHENIIGIYRYDEKEKEYIPFSFDEEKNKKLLQQYYLEKEELKKLLKERIEKGISRGNYNALTGNEIIVPNHKSNDKRWIRVEEVEKNNIKVNENEKPMLTILTGKNEKGNLKITTVEFYNISQLQITKEIEQKFVPMKQKEQEKTVEESRDKGIGIGD